MNYFQEIKDTQCSKILEKYKESIKKQLKSMAEPEEAPVNQDPSSQDTACTDNNTTDRQETTRRFNRTLLDSQVIKS